MNSRAYDLLLHGSVRAFLDFIDCQFFFRDCRDPIPHQTSAMRILVSMRVFVLALVTFSRRRAPSPPRGCPQLVRIDHLPAVLEQNLRASVDALSKKWAGSSDEERLSPFAVVSLDEKATAKWFSQPTAISSAKGNVHDGGGAPAFAADDPEPTRHTPRSSWAWSSLTRSGEMARLPPSPLVSRGS